MDHQTNARRKQFATLFALPFDEVAVMLKNQSEEVIQDFINYMFDVLEYQTVSTSAPPEISEVQYKIDVRLALTWCTWILSGGTTPNTYLAQVKEKSKSKVCTKVWNDGYYFYRCRDCEMSPSSSVCFECFQNGKHEGHDFIFERSVYGGCCDCGNPHAWKESGFCPAHNGSSAEDPSLILAPEMKNITRIVLRALIHRLLRYIPGTIEKHEVLPTHIPIILAVVNWLRFIGSYGDALLHLVRLEFMYGPDPKPVEQYLNSTLSLKDDALDEILFLFLDLLQDPHFKEQFIVYYIKLYPALIQHMIDTNGEVNVVYKISPQLFSIPTITYPLSKQRGGIYDMILDQLYKFFSDLSVINPLTNLKMVDCDNKYIAPHNYYAFTNDLNTLLGSPQLAQVLVTERLELFALLMKIMELLQGVDSNTRKTDTYVEYESETWKSAFSLEVELSRSVISVVEGFRAEFEGEAKNSNALPRMQKVFNVLCETLWHWLSAQHIPVIEWNGYEMAEYDIATQGVTVHIPLHRALSRFIHTALKIYPEISLAHLLNLKSFPKDFVTLFIEHPLHIHVLLAQSRADLWIRNGFSVINQVYLYRGSYFMESFNADVMLMQAGLVLLGPEVFFEICLSRFGMRDWFMIYEALPSDTKELIIVEDFFRFIITIVTERSRIGASQKSVLRREIIHQLAVEDLTHSKLTSELNHRLVEHKEFDSVLREVSVYRAPTISGAPGIFSLKAECWKEFEPFFPRYEPQSLQKAMERYAPQKPKRITSIPVEKPFLCFSSVNNLLHNAHLHYCYFMILYNSTFKSHLSHMEGPIRCVLHLILLTLENRIENEEFQELNTRKDIFPSADLAVNARSIVGPTGSCALLCLIEMYKNPKYQEHMDYVETILKRLASIDMVNRNIIVENIPDFEKSESTTKESTDSEAKKRARERQAAILAQFANAQKAFLKASEDEPDKESMEEDKPSEVKPTIDDYETISAGSLCALCRSETPAAEGRVLGFIALVQPTKILTIAKDQDVNRTEHKRRVLKTNLSKEEEEQRTEPKKPSFKLSESPTFKKRADVVPESDSEDEMHIETIDVNNNNNDLNPLANTDSNEEPLEYPLLKNIDEQPNVYVQRCGHCMHDDCFTSFFSSIIKRHFQFVFQQRTSPTNVDRGEFYCPVCRRLSNALIPIISKEFVENQESMELKPTDLAAWSSLSFPPMPKRLPTPASQVLSELALRIQCVQKHISILESITKPGSLLTTSEFLPLYLDILIANVASVEVTSRHKAFAGALSGALLSLQSFERCTKTVSNFYETSLKRQQLEYVFDIFYGKPCHFTTETGETQTRPPLLTLELFGMFARLLFLAPGGLNNSNNTALLLKSVYLAHIVQLFLHIYFTHNQLEDLSNIDIPTALLESFQFVISRFSKNSQISITDSHLQNLIKPLCVPFLRRCAILLNTLLPDAYPIGDLNNMNFDSLIQSLRLPALDIIFTLNDLSYGHMVQQFTYQLVEFIGNKSTFSLKMLPRMGPARSTKMIELPGTFQELVLKFMGIKCSNCDTVPKQGGLCLLCGTLVCVASNCCYKGERGECSQHAAECPGGIFLILKSTYVLIIRDEKRVIWGSLYLDEHGEEDPNMRRGKTLYFNQNRYEELMRLWLTQSFDHDSKIVSATVQDGHFM